MSTRKNKAAQQKLSIRLQPALWNSANSSQSLLDELKLNYPHSTCRALNVIYGPMGKQFLSHSHVWPGPHS